MPGAIWAIVVAGGEGSRFGGAKQFVDLDGLSVLERSVRNARSVADAVIAVVPKRALLEPSLHGGADLVVAGGSDRAGSVRAGLAHVPSDVEIIIVHDAARPLASPDLFHGVVAAISDGVDGAVPGLALTDTIKRVVNRVVVETLDRNVLVGVQTPQAFRASVLREAHTRHQGATDDAALLEQIGATVVLVPGEVHNIKLTDPGDIDAALVYLRALEQGALNE